MFEEVMSQLEEHGASQRKMFGHRCLMAGGKGFAIDYQDEIVIKLPEPDRAEALALEGSQMFDPMHGRPMKEWIQIPAEHAEEWLRFAEAGQHYVEKL